MSMNGENANLFIHHLKEGSILNGRYRIDHALGEGGFGITYEGWDTLLDMKVAIKEYYPHGYANRNNENSQQVTLSMGSQKDFFEKGKKKFLNEARVLAKFAGTPGIVNVRDFFETNGTAYIVMDFLNGVTLKDYIKTHGAIAADELCNLMLPLLESLGKIHKAGLIHRDISPDNIMLMPNHTLVLMDFGAARDMSPTGQKSLSVMLKPGYAPEEQYRSRGQQGPWTDIYAISATMYKCLTGVTPDDSMQRVFEDEVKAPSELGVCISKTQEDAIMTGMSVLQKNRWQTAAQLANALQGISTSNEEHEELNHVEISNAFGEESSDPDEDGVTMSMADEPVPESDEDEDGVTMPMTEEPIPESDEDGVTIPMVDESHSEASVETSVLEKPETVKKPEAVGKPAASGETDSNGVQGVEKKPETIEKSKTVKSPETEKPKSPEEEKVTKKYKNKDITNEQKDRKPEQNKPKTDNTGKKKSGKILAAVAAAVVIVVMIGVFVISRLAGSTVTIAGINVSNDITFQSFIDKDLTTEDMEALASLKNLRTLTFEGCTFDDNAWDALANMKGTLESLKIIDCTGVTDLEWISDCVELSVLTISGSGITDTKLAEINFSGFGNLTTLDLSNNEQLTDISLLSSVMGTLTTLDLSQTGITDLSVLSSGEKLVTLDASGNGITDISFLKGMTSIKTLTLNDNQISSLAGLADCVNLEALYVDNNQLSNLGGIQNAIKLQYISAANNSLYTLEALENATILIEANFDGNGLFDEDMEVLAKSSSTLESVSVKSNCLTDISFLKNATAMQYLYLDDNEITSLEALAGMGALKVISADHNQIKSLDGIIDTNSGVLEYISLADNKLTNIFDFEDIESVKQGTQFKLVDFSCNELEYVSALSGISCDYLAIYDNPIVSYDSLEEITGKKIWFAYTEGISYQGIAGGFTNYMELDCPMDKRVEAMEAINLYDGDDNLVFGTIEEADEEAAAVKAELCE